VHAVVVLKVAMTKQLKDREDIAQSTTPVTPAGGRAQGPAAASIPHWTKRWAGVAAAC